MTANPTTLVVGGSFRRIGSKLLVQRRSWEMIRIFADRLAQPIFAMHEVHSDQTLAFELPDDVAVVSLPQEGAITRLVKSMMNIRMSGDIESVIENGAVVYLRLPDWSCWRVFNRAVSKGNRLIASLHGDWAEEYRCREGNIAKRLAFNLMASYVDAAYRKIARNCEILFCTGNALHSQYGTLARKSIVIANFLHSVDDVCSPDRKSVATPLRILFVGHMEERKGLIYLLKSLDLLIHEGTPARLTIVGAGPLRESLGQAATDLGLTQFVEFVDYIQYGEELMQRYRDADVFVLPSISSEGVPKVLMEAMSQGLPVISTDVGSSKELLGDGKSGVIVQRRNERQLADSIRTLIENDTLRCELIRNGLELARKSTREVQSLKVDEALQSAIPEATGSPSYLGYPGSEKSSREAGA